MENTCTISVPIRRSYLDGKGFRRRSDLHRGQNGDRGLTNGLGTPGTKALAAMLSLVIRPLPAAPRAEAVVDVDGPSVSVSGDALLGSGSGATRE